MSIETRVYRIEWLILYIFAKLIGWPQKRSPLGTDMDSFARARLKEITEEHINA